MTARNNVVNYAADDGRATSAGRVLAKCHPQSVPVCRPLGRIFHQIRPAETFFSADIQISRILLKLQNSAKIRLNTRNSATETITPPPKKLTSRVTLYAADRAGERAERRGRGAKNPLSDSNKILHRGKGPRPDHPRKIWWPSVWEFRGHLAVKIHPFPLNCSDFRCRP